MSEAGAGSGSFWARLFWLGLGGVAWTFAGYHGLMTLLGRARPAGSTSAKPAGQKQDWPRVSVVVAVRNEETRIAARLENLLKETEYPAERLEVVIVDDGSTDRTADVIRDYESSERLHLVEAGEALGKAACLNRGIEAAEGEIVVLGDARQRFAPGAIKRLAAAFEDPQVGAVSGNLEIAESRDGAGGGVDTYWRLEKHLRAAESAFDSAIGCTGAIYAIRRRHFRALPEDTLLDDVVIPMRIAEQGYRVLFDRHAVAWDPQELNPVHEKRRKRRTLAGNFQMLARYPHWLLPPPLGHRLWWQLISHKYLRLCGPVFLVLALLGNLGAVLRGRGWFYALALLGQLALYGLATLGLGRKTAGRLLSVPAGFVFLNWQVLEGLRFYLAQNGRKGWG